jgi:hypothetical protein
MGKDIRDYTSQTEFRLIVGAILILFIIGGGLILIIYGPAAAGLGITCLLMTLLPVSIIILFLWVLDWIVKRENSK